MSWDEVGGNLKRCLAVGRMCDPKLQVLGSLHDAEKCFKTSVVGASACLHWTVGQRSEDPGPDPDVRSAWKVQHPWFLSLVSTCGMRVWAIPAVLQPALYWAWFPGMGKEEREASLLAGRGTYLGMTAVLPLLQACSFTLFAVCLNEHKNMKVMLGE